MGLLRSPTILRWHRQSVAAARRSKRRDATEHPHCSFPAEGQSSGGRIGRRGDRYRTRPVVSARPSHDVHLRIGPTADELLLDA